MNDNDTAAGSGDVGGASNAVLAFHPHFPDRSFQMLDVWLPHFRKPLGLDQARAPQEARDDVLWHCFRAARTSASKILPSTPFQNHTVFKILPDYALASAS